MIIESNDCVECGCDTRKEGFVNRVPYLSDVQDAYICGNCLAFWDEEYDLMVVDGVYGFDSTRNEDSVISILEDRIRLAERPEDRAMARQRLAEANDFYNSKEWLYT